MFFYQAFVFLVPPCLDLWTPALPSPYGRTETRKVKNISANQFGDKLGRIHLGRQDLSSMKVTVHTLSARLLLSVALASLLL